MSLVLETARAVLLGVVVLGLLLFLPAGTLAYWQAWALILVFVACGNATGIYLLLRDPELLSRRMRFGPAAEPRAAQRVIMSLLLVVLLALLVFCALDHRFRWSPVPAPVSVAGNALVALGFLIDFLVLRANRYGASTIRTFEGQTAVTTGPYAVVRHPMYAGAVVMLPGVPLALGSWWGLAFLVLLVPLLVWRILDEEELLTAELPGYAEYKKRTRYRLVPFVW